MIPLDQQHPHYQGVYCPTCRQDTLPDQYGRCHWCDHYLECRNGHQRTAKNTVISGGKTRCLTCRRATDQARYYHKRKTAAA